MLLSLFIFLLAASLGAKASSRRALTGQPNVTLDYGTFVGFKNDTTGIVSFLGVPFADPPIGELRWKKPVFPPSQHRGVVDAIKLGHACVNGSQTEVDHHTSEDCLFANIHIPPGTTSNSSLPVVVWFHGGGFQYGSTHDRDPAVLMQSSSSPFIFASFAYRLGQFGFLAGSTIGANATLNAGLHDQRAGLRWVNRYIHEFGGNPSQVTIWGQSAGAASTMLHLLVNDGDTEGLFHAAIGHSPSHNDMPFFWDDYLEDIFHEFATYAGCDPADQSTVLSCLRAAHTNDLTSAGSRVSMNRPATLFTFTPILDDDFLRTRPIDGFTSGKFAKVPVLFGANADDGAFMSAGLPDPSANTVLSNATQMTVFNFLKGQFVTLTEASFNRSLELYPLSDYNNSFDLQGQQMYGELRYICAAALISQGAAKAGSPAFHFHYENPHLKSYHGSEARAFFPDDISSTIIADPNDEALFEVMREYWTSFITLGNPVSDGSLVVGDVHYPIMIPMIMNSSLSSGTSMSKVPMWDPASNSTSGGPRIYLHPEGIQMQDLTDGFVERCAFWHSLKDELNM